MQLCCAKPQSEAFKAMKQPVMAQNRFGFVGALLPAIEQAVLSTSVKAVGSGFRVSDTFDGLSTRPTGQQVKQEAINLAAIGAFTFGFRMMFTSKLNKYANAGVWMAAYAASETISRVATVLTSDEHKAEVDAKHHHKHRSALQGSAMEAVILPAISSSPLASNPANNRQTLFGNHAFLTSNTGFAPNVVTPQAGQTPFSLASANTTHSSSVPLTNPFMVA
jgi:hypothetical protein